MSVDATTSEISPTSDASDDEGFEELITNYKAILNHANKDEDDAKLDELFAKVFHRDLIKVYDGKEWNYQDLLQKSLREKREGFKPKLFRYKRIDATSFSSYLRLVNDDTVIVSHQVYHMKDSKIIRIDAVVVEETQKVAGQLSSTDRLVLAGSNLSERELSAKVYKPPSEIGDKLLDSGSTNKTSTMSPVHVQYEFIRIVLEIHKPGLYVLNPGLLKNLFKAEDVIPISDSRRLPYADGAYLKRSKRLGLRVRLVLYDYEGKAIAKCVVDQGVLGKSAMIYGAYPLCSGGDGDNNVRHDTGILEGSVDSGSAQDEAKDCVFPWFRCSVGEDDMTRGMYFVSVWTGAQQFQRYLKVLPATPGSKCFLVVDFYEGDIVLGVVQKSDNDSSDNKDGIQVDVAPGADPSMMICFAAILYEVVS